MSNRTLSLLRASSLCSPPRAAPVVRPGPAPGRPARTGDAERPGRGGDDRAAGHDRHRGHDRRRGHDGRRGTTGVAGTTGSAGTTGVAGRRAPQRGRRRASRAAAGTTGSAGRPERRVRGGQADAAAERPDTAGTGGGAAGGAEGETGSAGAGRAGTTARWNGRRPDQHGLRLLGRAEWLRHGGRHRSGAVRDVPEGLRHDVPGALGCVGDGPLFRHRPQLDHLLQVGDVRVELVALHPVYAQRHAGPDAEVLCGAERDNQADPGLRLAAASPAGADPENTDRGIKVNSDWTHVKGFEVMHANDNGIHIQGANGIVENCVVHDNDDTGIQIGVNTSAPAGTSGINNTVKDCDSYHNFDEANGGENADGFGMKEASGTGNQFIGCRPGKTPTTATTSTPGSAPSDSRTAGPTEARATRPITGSISDGNGFKLGGDDTGGNHQL